MKTDVKRLYEAMFLIDTALAAADWDGIIDMIKNLLEKNGAEIVSLRKWDEARLAYPVNKKERGTYILCYFHSDPTKVTVIERNIVLNENIMRALILKADHVTEEDMAKETPAMKSERAAAEQPEAGAGSEAQAQAPQAEQAQESQAADENEEPVEQESAAENEEK